MKAVHISPSSASEASAAHRIRSAQRKNGVDAVSLVHKGISSDFNELFDKPENASLRLKIFHKLNRFMLIFYTKRRVDLPWSFAWFGYDPVKKLLKTKADIVNLHWVSSGCISFKSLSQLKIPIVWTLHDVWPITGGCHCNLGCDRWISGCKMCPQLSDGTNTTFLSANFFKFKLHALQEIQNLVVVCPSLWLAGMAKKSPLFSNRIIEVIPNCINTDVYKPLNKKFEIRSELGIPKEAKVILFGAVDSISSSYKGFDLLIESLRKLKTMSTVDYHLVIFGNNGELKVDLPYKSTLLGHISDEKILIKIYNCADVFVGPSMQDNFPNTFLEAMSCGIPAVGFSVGGIPEIVDHLVSGYIAKCFETSELADGIFWILDDEKRRIELSKISRDKVLQNYSEKIVSNKYMQLYDSALRAWK